MKESIGIKGKFIIERLTINGKLIDVKEVDNMIMQYVRTSYLKMLSGGAVKASDIKIRYMAFGDGTTPVTINDTKLANERYRQQITAKSLQDTELITTVSVSPFVNDSNFNIKEIGVFGGDDATNEANSGNLLARVLVDIDKNSNVILNVTRIDKVII